MTSDLNTMLRIARDAWEGGYATIVATVNAALAKRAGNHRLASGDGVRPVPLSLALRSIRRALHCDEIDAMWQCSFDVNHRKVLIGVRPEHAVPWTVADIGIGSSAHPEGDLQAAIQRIEIRAHETTWRPENVVRSTEEVAAWWRRWFDAILRESVPNACVIVRNGDNWHIEFKIGDHTESGGYPHRKGMAYAQELIRACPRGIEALELEARERADGTAGATEARALRVSRQESLDKETIRHLRQMRAKIVQEIEELQPTDPTAAEAMSRIELAPIDRQIANSVGLGGRPRSFVDESEKSRKRVGDALREVRKQLAASMPRLARHLDICISGTGTTFSYRPESPVSWRVD